MIYALTGKTGGGKSYESVKNYIIPFILSGRRIVTNIPLKLDHFRAVYGDEIVDELIIVVEYDFHNYGSRKIFSEPQDYEKYQDWKNEKGQSVAFFIDEAHLSLPVSRTDTPVLEYYSMHRHAGVDIYLITQNMRKVHRDIRDLVDLEYRCKKLAMVGKPESYIVKVHDGVGGHVNNEYQREYEKHVFPFYKSHTRSEEPIEEDTAKQTSNSAAKWSKFGYVFIVLGLFWMVSLFTGNDEKEVVPDVKKQPQIINQVTPKKEPGAQKVNPFQTIDNTELEPVKKLQKMPTQEKTINEKMYDEYENRSKSYHPYHNVDLHITSTSSYWSDELKRVVKQITIGASRNGQMLFTFDYNDLWLAGYTMEVLGACNIRLTYFDYENYVLCDQPTVTVASAIDGT